MQDCLSLVSPGGNAMQAQDTDSQKISIPHSPTHRRTCERCREKILPWVHHPLLLFSFMLAITNIMFILTSSTSATFFFFRVSSRKQSQEYEQHHSTNHLYQDNRPFPLKLSFVSPRKSRPSTCLLRVPLCSCWCYWIPKVINKLINAQVSVSVPHA